MDREQTNFLFDGRKKYVVELKKLGTEPYQSYVCEFNQVLSNFNLTIIKEALSNPTRQRDKYAVSPASYEAVKDYYEDHAQEALARKRNQLWKDNPENPT